MGSFSGARMSGSGNNQMMGNRGNFGGGGQGGQGFNNTEQELLMHVSSL